MITKNSIKIKRTSFVSFAAILTLGVMLVFNIFVTSSGTLPRLTKALAASICTVGIHPAGSCSNAECPSYATEASCYITNLTGAGTKACVYHDDMDYVVDCCPEGQVMNSNKTACVGTAVTSSPPPPPTTTVPPTSTPTPTHTPTNTPTRTPTKTPAHTAEDTGFEDAPLLYIGGVLYAVGVIAFVSARYFGAARTK